MSPVTRRSSSPESSVGQRRADTTLTCDWWSIGCPGKSRNGTRSTRWVATSASPSPCSSVSKNQAGRRFGAPATSFRMWWTLSISSAGWLSVPGPIVPATCGSWQSSRCRIVVISERSVITS